MNGSEWLQHIFVPELQHGTQQYVLRAQLKALHDCEVLDAAQLAEAERLLHANTPEVHPPATVAPAPSNSLRRVLAPAVPLADIDGVTYVVTTIELWEHTVDVFVAGVPSSETTRREHAAELAMAAWVRARRSGAVRDGLPPDRIGTTRLGLLIDISDDLGTPYRLGHSSSGGSGGEWRIHLTCKPGVPTEATTLTVHVNDDDNRPLLTRAIRLHEEAGTDPTVSG